CGRRPLPHRDEEAARGGQLRGPARPLIPSPARLLVDPVTIRGPIDEQSAFPGVARGADLVLRCIAVPDRVAGWDTYLLPGSRGASASRWSRSCARPGTRSPGWYAARRAPTTSSPGTRPPDTCRRRPWTVSPPWSTWPVPASATSGG